MTTKGTVITALLFVTAVIAYMEFSQKDPKGAVKTTAADSSVETGKEKPPTAMFAQFLSTKAAIPSNVTLIPPSGGGSAYSLDPPCVYAQDGELPPAYYANGKRRKSKKKFRILKSSFTLKDAEELVQSRALFKKEGTMHQFIWELFGRKENGFFIESGGHDGCRESHTIWLESKKNWKGLLVEPNPGLFARLKTLNRNAWASQSCLPIYDGVHSATFLMHGALGGLADTISMDHVRNIRKFSKESEDVDSGANVTATCVPLHHLIRHATGHSDVIPDIWILDVEGAEVLVLKNTPPLAKVVAVEHNAVPGKRQQIYDILTSRGYSRFFGEHMDDWYVSKEHCAEIGKCFEWPKELI
eukprot:TRINITY_DN5383_c3_g1_i1.p1 TRINITY_DN5383_c3_g1~~TRINITY_DN5383_c3_g1_i1.p1  ORF type:complete len:380 (+),score=67.48 TRINITY_DN5383_c3_g1_i1:71-1141(+)